MVRHLQILAKYESLSVSNCELNWQVGRLLIHVLICPGLRLTGIAHPSGRSLPIQLCDEGTESGI